VSADNLQTRWPYCDNGIEELFGQRKLWIDISGRSHQLEEMEQSYLDNVLAMIEREPWLYYRRVCSDSFERLNHEAARCWFNNQPLVRRLRQLCEEAPLT
jgi:hypothetical protein